MHEPEAVKLTQRKSVSALSLTGGNPGVVPALGWVRSWYLMGIFFVQFTTIFPGEPNYWLIQDQGCDGWSSGGLANRRMRIISIRAGSAIGLSTSTSSTYSHIVLLPIDGPSILHRQEDWFNLTKDLSISSTSTN